VKLHKNVRKWRDFYNPYCNTPGNERIIDSTEEANKKTFFRTSLFEKTGAADPDWIRI
jgi:hypothetical protein